MARQRHRLTLVTALAVVMTSVALPSLAWAHYRPSGSGSTTFSTHVLLVDAQPTCPTISVLTVTLTWAAPTDAAYVTSYEVGKSSSSGGPYTYSSAGTGPSTNVVVVLGDFYFVIRSLNHNWQGPSSPERHVHAVLVASCP